MNGKTNAAVLCVALTALAAGVSAREVWTPAPLGSLKVGGTIGERIALTVDGNLKKIDYDKVFVNQFRTKDAKKTFVGTGNVMESLVLLARQTGDRELLKIKEKLVSDILAAQASDGYIGCVRPEQRIWNSWDCEEVGFILDALVLDYVHFGNKTSLDAAVRGADWMLANWKNPTKGYDKFIYDKEILMGIAHGVWSVYDQTKNPAYRTFLTSTFDYLNWDMPVVLERDIGLKGHACGYLDTCYAQLAMYRTLGDPRLVRQTNRFLDHYLHGDGGLVTGLEGICECLNDSQEGSGCIGETCMSSYLLYTMDLALRTGAVDPALAGNIMERTLHNAFFAAQDRDGRRLRYYTPLEGVRNWWPTDDYCCPVNYRRAMGHVPEMLLYTNGSTLFANLYSPLEGEVAVGGVAVRVKEETDYPTSGKVRFALSPAAKADFTFALRIPEWCDAATVRVNGAATDVRMPGKVFSVTRSWSAGDAVEVDFPMELRLVRGRKRQSGRCAFMRGPLVYATDLRFITDENRHPEEAANSEGVRNEDLFVVWPETAKVVSDDRARTGGTAIKVKGSLVSCQLGPECGWAVPREFTFTEFPDPADTITYFRVSSARGKPVDDPLFVPQGK